MERLHVHLSVSDLDDSIRFYSTLFGTAPIVRKDDYAKWMVDDPRVNFAISGRNRAPGLHHLGIQVEDADDLSSVAERLASAGRSVLEEKDARCCYARSDKAWVSDPQGIAWETFLTRGPATTYGGDTEATEELEALGSAVLAEAPKCECCARAG